MAVVKYPKNPLAIRAGKGFSRGEIKEARLTLDFIKKEKIPFDPRRKTVHKENIEALKTLKTKPKSKPKKTVVKPVKKKKEEPVKPEKQKTKKTRKTEDKRESKKVKKPKTSKTKKETTKKKKEDEIIKEAISKLTKIKGLTQSDAKKLVDIGIMSKKDLVEMSDDFDIVSEETGIPISKLKKWVK